MTKPRRILLDECVPANLRREIPGYGVRAVREYGWAGKLNGELLRAANAEFDVFVTVDRNRIHQQNLAGLHIAIIARVVHHTRIREIRRLPPGRVRTLEWIEPGQVVTPGPPEDQE